MASLGVSLKAGYCWSTAACKISKRPILSPRTALVFEFRPTTQPPITDNTTVAFRKKLLKPLLSTKANVH